MLTVNFSQRFLFKWKYVFVLLATIACGTTVLSLYIDRWLPDYSLSYSHLVAQQSKTRISFSKVRYRFPNYLILKDVKIYADDEKPPILQADSLVLGFSFPFFSPSIRLNSMFMDGWSADLPALKNYWAAHGQDLVAWLNEIPHGNLKFTIPRGKILDQGRTIGFMMNGQNNTNKAHISGSWNNKKTFYYELDGHFQPSGFDADKFTLKQGRSLMDLWGRWHGPDIDWNGFVFYDKYYVLDIDGHVQLQDKAVVLKRLSFTLDKNSVYIAGACSRQGLFSCDADIALRRPVQDIDRQAPLKDIRMRLHAQNTSRGLLFKGASDFHFIFDASSTALQGIHVDFDNLKPVVVNDQFFSLKIDGMQSTLLVQGRPHLVPMHSVLASFNYAKPYQKAIAMSADIFSGHVYNRIFINTSSMPWVIKAQGRFEGIDIRRLADSFSFFKNGRGFLSGDFNLETHKEIKLDGRLNLHQGDFEGSDFQKWLAKILQMPSLSHVGGMELSSRFKIEGRAKKFDAINIATDGFDLKGFYHLDADDFVSSQLSLRFSKGLLSESPIGRQVIGLVHGAWTLPFEFRLSGNLYRENFQWDTSPLKDRVREHMFSFFERMIDDRIDQSPIP